MDKSLAQSDYYDVTSDDFNFYFDDYSDTEFDEGCPSYTEITDEIFALNLSASGEADYPGTAVTQMAIADSDYGTYTLDRYLYWFGTEPAGNCGLVSHYHIAFSVPLMHIKAYYYYTNQYSKTDGKYIGVYKRCNPIGTTCDSCDITIGSPPFAPYGLFDGAEIHIGITAACAMALVEAVSKCYAPDPIPGTGKGASNRFPSTKTPWDDMSPGALAKEKGIEPTSIQAAGAARR